MGIFNNDEIPAGLSMALVENIRAVEAFGKLDETERQAVIYQAKKASSKQEMRSIVSELNHIR